jgi:ribose 5-phosphate isomerase A
MNSLVQGTTPVDLSAAENGKRQAGEAAAEAVVSGMRLGLGTGSSVAFFLDALGRRIKAGELEDISGVPTSERTAEACRSLGIGLTTLDDDPVLDLAVDGADEVDPDLHLIKGLGGALLREMLVAGAARRFTVIVDPSKLVTRLGTRSPVPIEVTPFGWKSHLPFFRDRGADPVLRELGDGQPYLTDNGNLIIDLHFSGGIEDAYFLRRALLERPGVVGTGLFLGMADEVLVGRADGVERMVRGGSR